MQHRGLDNYLHELGLGLINPYMLGQVLAVKKWRPGCSWLSSESKSTTVLPFHGAHLMEGGGGGVSVANFFVILSGL